jgi:tRNA-dihydrouridine synthase A
MPVAALDRRLAVAPMMDVTDRHCRYFLRQISRRTLLYTEMVTTGALLHGDADRHLRFHPEEHPLALQLGGSEPDDLARCTELAARYGYDEVNLNIGCPSERVQRGAFGACLMAEPRLVAECVRRMRGASPLPVTVKHRIGIDHIEDYAFMRRFVETVAQAGCATFIVHARNAILKGLSPKQNREVPPLRYQLVHRLKQELPALEIIINGGITTWPGIETQLRSVDGVMIGRAAENDPWMLAEADTRAFGVEAVAPTRAGVIRRMIDYAREELVRGAQLRHIVRHMHGLYRTRPVARRWRQMLADNAALRANDVHLLERTLVSIEQRDFVDTERAPGTERFTAA